MDVQRRLASGEMEPLSQGNIEQEAAGLREDLLNWDHQHVMDPDFAPLLELSKLTDMTHN